MILPNRDRKTASVALILKRLKGSDYEGMQSKNSDYMTSEDRMSKPGYEDMEMESQMHDDKVEELMPCAHKVMKAMEQKDEKAFAYYMMDLIRKMK